MRGSTRCCLQARWNDPLERTQQRGPPGDPVKRRLALIALLALAIAPGTWFRTPINEGFGGTITLRRVQGPSAIAQDGWQLLGVWEYDADSMAFGGYSALLTLDDGRLRAFSDRGTRLTFITPDMPQARVVQSTSERSARFMDAQPVADKYYYLLWDIESATRDPATGQYWLGYEFRHGFQRFSADSEPQGVRIINDEVDWPSNAGAEAMVRLDDGRFIVVPEGGGQGLIYPADPVGGAKPTTFDFRSPIAGFGVTDAAQLPDGRLLLLMRKVAWGWPPFDVRIAIADVPQPGGPQVMTARPALDLTRIAPRDNYEGITVSPRDDGGLDVWVISDDNLASIQRTLVVKLRFDPYAARPSQDPGK